MWDKNAKSAGSASGHVSAAAPDQPSGGVSADSDGGELLPGRAARWLSWIVGLAILAGVIVATLHFTAGREFLRLTGQVQPWWLALAIALQANTYLAQGEVWRLVARAAGLSLPIWLAFKLSLTNLFINQALPSGGISWALIVSRVLTQNGIPRPVIMAAVVIDGTAYYVAYVAALVAALCISVAGGDAPPLLLAAALLLAVFGSAMAAGVLALAGRTSAAHGWFMRVPVLHGVLSRLSAADAALSRNAPLLLKSTLAHLAIVLLDTGTVWVLIRSLGGMARPDTVFTSLMAATLLRTLSIVPGGLGVFEAASVVTLQHAGVPLPVSLAATLLFRGLSFWLPMVPGLLFAQQGKTVRSARPAYKATADDGKKCEMP